jgi:hypothetical protein
MKSPPAFWQFWNGKPVAEIWERWLMLAIRHADQLTPAVAKVVRDHVRSEARFDLIEWANAEPSPEEVFDAEHAVEAVPGKPHRLRPVVDADIDT